MGVDDVREVEPSVYLGFSGQVFRCKEVRKPEGSYVMNRPKTEGERRTLNPSHIRDEE